MSDLTKLRLTALALAVCLAVGLALDVGVFAPRTPPVVVTGEAAVGGPFRLTDQAGNTVTRDTFRGRSVVLYFGWRLDPDLTPAALQVLVAALDTLGPKSERIARVFVTLDPDRDAMAQLSEFASKIDRRLIALRGSPEDIETLARAYKLYFKRLPDASLPGGYSIDHASLYYVLGSDGGFRGIVPHTTDAAALASEIIRLMD